MAAIQVDTDTAFTQHTFIIRQLFRAAVDTGSAGLRSRCLQAACLSGDLRGESVSLLTPVVGGIQFLVGAGLRSLFSCWPSAESCIQFQEAAHIPRLAAVSLHGETRQWQV